MGERTTGVTFCARAAGGSSTRKRATALRTVQRLLLLASLVLPLTGCDDSGAPKAMAECSRLPDAHEKNESGDFWAVRACMEDRGYFEDTELEVGGAKCASLDYPEKEPGCYRPRKRGLYDILCGSPREAETRFIARALGCRKTPAGVQHGNS